MFKTIKIHNLLFLIFLFCFNLVTAQETQIEEEKIDLSFTKRKKPSYEIEKAKVLEFIEAKQVDEFLEYMQNQSNSKDIQIGEREHVLTYLFKTGNLEFAKPLLENYKQNFGTPFPKTSIHRDSLAYLKPACHACQIDLLKSLSDDGILNIKPSFILQLTLIKGCEDEERLISFFEKTDAIEEIDEKVHPTIGITAIKNNKLKIIRYLVEKKNLKLEKRLFFNIINNLETLNLLWELGMQHQGFAPVQRESLVKLLWEKASVQQINEIIERGIIDESDLTNDKLLGKDFLANANTAKIKYARDLFLSEEKTIKFYRVKNKKSEARLYTREEMFMILDVLENTDYYTFFAKSIPKPKEYDEYVQFIIFQASLAADRELFDYLVSEKLIKVNITNMKRETVLHYAAIAGDVSFFKYIYEKYNLSTFLSQKDSDGFSPLGLAKKYSRTELITFLESLGAR